MELNKKNVLDIQYACNPTAVANQLARWSAEVVRTQGTKAAREHPLLRAVVGKLADMYGIDHTSPEVYAALYEKDEEA